MDFKSIISKLDSMDAPTKTPAAPSLPQAMQLNEDAQLRVLSGRSTYVAEAKKKAEEDVKEEMKVGDKKPSSTGGTIEKTKTGVKHTSGKNYGGDSAPADSDEDDAPKAKKAKKESIEPEFKSKFMKMVEAKKSTKMSKKEKMEEGSKPDFLDMDKDGDKKEPMKKAVADKKKNPFAKKDEKVKEAAEKTASSWTDKSGKKHPATSVKGDKYTGKDADSGKGAPKKDLDDLTHPVDRKKKTVKESVEQKLSFKEMLQMVQESGGQQQIDPIDAELFAWASRIAKQKLGENMKAQVYAGMVYERMGGVFEMYDVLSEDQK